MPPSLPETIGKYKIEDIIAKGGMGVVYKALHPSLKRNVVIKKMISRKSSTNAERFKREAQILLDLQSPYIVHLYDYFTEGSYRYMVEELVDGLALDKILQKQKVLSPQLALLILQDTCFALKYAHSKDIIHRDIKPGNILISRKAEIKLADFGIASDKETNEDNLTANGIALGTPAYMPPEQFENSASCDQRSDIYALGIMLYEMITGSKPYPGTLSIETLNIIKKGKYTNPRKLNPEIPLKVCRLISKMLKPKASQRYQSVEPILKTCKRYLKHYDTHAIRVQLARIILSKDTYNEEKYIPKDKVLRKTYRIILGSLLATSLLCYLWIQGYIHKTLLNHWFKSVTIEMTLPATSMDLPVKSFIYKNDGKDIPLVKGSERTFTLNKNQDSKKNLKYTIKPIYLTKGNYRCKVSSGPYVWWENFTVTNKAVVLKSSVLQNARRKLNIKPYVYDSETGLDISQKTKVYVTYKNAWYLVENLPEGAITSNSIVKLKFTSEGYNDEVFTLKLDWYQDELLLCAKMKKIK